MKVTVKQIEVRLEHAFRKKFCSYEYPGFPRVYGWVEEISIDPLSLPDLYVIILMSRKGGVRRYAVDLEYLKECLKVVEHGNSQRGSEGDGIWDSQKD